MTEFVSGRRTLLQRLVGGVAAGAGLFGLSRTAAAQAAPAPATLVNIGVDLGKMNTVGDLQGGIEEAERLLGYKVFPIAEAPSA